MIDFLKEYKTFLIILLGALITVIGALLDNKAKLKEKQESLNKEMERSNQYVTIIKKSDKMLESQQAVIQSNSKIIELQNSLASANQKIAELQNTTINQITGGDNVPKLSFVGSDHSLQCDIINKGKFPIRNL
jgi:hypothetical protein